MTARNDITGDSIASRPSSDAYRDNYDRIFGKKNTAQSGSITLSAELFEEAKQYTTDPDALVRFLREQGLSKAQSVIAYSRIMVEHPNIAKKFIHFHPVWQDRKAGDDALQEEFMQVLEAHYPPDESETGEE